MFVALGLCELDPPIVPKTADPVGDIDDAPGLSIDDCLRQWVKVFDGCKDEPDQQYKCAVADVRPE